MIPPARSAVPRGPVTDALVALVVVVGVLPWLVGRGGDGGWVAGLVPVRLTGVDPLAHAGAFPPIVTVISYAFVASDLVALALYAATILLIGRFVEMAAGGRAVPLLALAGVIAGAIAYLLVPVAPDVPLTGAFNALSALVGGYALTFGQRTVPTGAAGPARRVRALSLLGGWTVLVAAMTVMGGRWPVPGTLLPPVAAFAVGLGLMPLMLRWRYRSA